LYDQGLVAPGERATWHPLAGGVSSDIWRVDVEGRSFCIKRALGQLKVAAEWRAPASRNAYEWAWMKFAAAICPDNVPKPIANDERAGLFAMSFLPPQEHPVWKQQLFEGHANPQTAASVGAVLGKLHSASANNLAIANAFDTIDNFYALRLEPYLVASAARHPHLMPRFMELMVRTAGTKHALVHGDVSPKNILVGPKGPVLLDAECAWYGDPAFDLAFCLNHLLLKGLVRPPFRGMLSESVAAMVESYFQQVDWEPWGKLETRAAQLLPALMLARVDGKSPVEYITQEGQRDVVRQVASTLIAVPVDSLAEVDRAWRKAID
jgi:5-methylthioribose kinase